MAEALGRPPSLQTRVLEKVLCKHFHFEKVLKDSVQPLPSFEDQNIYFKGETINSTCSEFVLKLSNPLCTPTEVLRGLHAAMNYVQECKFKFSTPYPLLSENGTYVVHLTRKELAGEDKTTDSMQSELQYHVQVFPFISGEILDSVGKHYLTPILLQEVGEMIAKLNKKLKENFKNEALESRKNPHWDLMNFPILKSFLYQIDDSIKRRHAEIVFSAYEKNVIPIIHSLEQGIVHCDPNGKNIIVKKAVSEDSYSVAGLIDFGHSLNTCVVFDLGICLAYIMLENANPVTSANVVEFVGPIIRGYHGILPLTEQEFNSLYYLAMARCLQSALNGERAYRAEPWNSYLLTTPKKAWTTIEILLKMTIDEVNKIWKTFLS